MATFPAIGASGSGTVTHPASIASAWVTLHNPTATPVGIDPVSIPTDATLANSNSRSLFRREKAFGTYVRVSVFYDAAVTATTSQATYFVLGRRAAVQDEDASQWRVLFTTEATRSAQTTVNPAVDAVQAFSAGSRQVWSGTPASCTFDMDGCDEFILEHTTALALTGGDSALARFCVKII